MPGQPLGVMGIGMPLFPNLAAMGPAAAQMQVRHQQMVQRMQQHARMFGQGLGFDDDDDLFANVPRGRRAPPLPVPRAPLPVPVARTRAQVAAAAAARIPAAGPARPRKRKR